jgi:hypothetical protein
MGSVGAAPRDVDGARGIMTGVPIRDALFWSAFGAILLSSAAVARRPAVFARWALLPVGRRVTLPLPSAVAAVVLRPDEGQGTYRELPPRSVDLAAFPGDRTVTLDAEILEFVPDRNWILARARAWLRSMSETLVRVEVSAADGALVLRARRLPTDLGLLLLAAAYIASLHRPLQQPLTLWLLAVAIIVGSVFGEQRRASRYFDAVVEEMKKRIAAVDPS